MSFHSPHLLWGLIPLVLLFAWELARHRSRVVATLPKVMRAWAGAFDVSLGSGGSNSDARPRICLWFGLAACLVALARPQWGVIEEKTFDQAREVLIAVDLSRSMLAQDVKPSRLDRSKLLIQSLLDGLKGERVGLVLFAGTAFLQSPLSADYEVLREFLPALSPDYLPEGGSNYKALLETSIVAFGDTAADRYLIILSDGESTVEDWKSEIDKLKTKDVRVIGLGVGTAQGSFIPDSTGGFVKDERGAVVMSRLNNSTLQELAQSTGGAYADASAWVDLPALLGKTVEAGRKGKFTDKSSVRLSERYQWFLAPGLLLLLLSFWHEFPVRPRERALPLAGRRERPSTPAATATTTAAALFVALAWLGLPARSEAQDAPAPTSAETMAAPLTKAVARLAEQSALGAKDYAELAQTTVTYGQRVKATQQPPPEGTIHDALQAVDLGEKADAKAADWPKLRQELQDLLKRDDQKKDDKKQDENKQQNDQQQNQDQQDQNKQNQDQQKQQQKDQQNDKQQKQDNSQQNQNQDQQQQQKQDSAFGDMKDQPDKKPPKPQPQPGTQKVGGQPDKQPTEQVDPELAMPLQKLEQVRNQDSPAKLQQLIQGGQQQKTKGTGKNW